MSNFSISTNGLIFIKKWEGCVLTAYKAVSTEQYYTIGYGHYGSDVKAGMTITQAQAEAYLKTDIAKFEKAVNSYNLSWMNQNRFDSLCSFAYNCGTGNLKTLLNSGKRTAAEVSAKITAYNKSNGVVIAGLVKRRAAEKVLFDTATTSTTATTSSVTYYSKYTGSSTSIVDALKAVGVTDTSLTHRKKIATANGISTSSTASMNTKLLAKLKLGTLIKA